MKNLIFPANIQLITMLISRMFLKTPSASAVLKDARKGLIFYLVSAMFAVSAILLVYFEIYVLLVEGGVTVTAAIAIVFILLIFTAFIFREIAKKYLSRAKEIKDSSKILTKAKSLDQKAEAIVKSFLEGLLQDSK